MVPRNFTYSIAIKFAFDNQILLFRLESNSSKMIKFYNMTTLETQLLLAALCISGILAILGSMYTFSFYFDKTSIVALLYKCMAVFDILSGVNAIFFVFLCLTYLKECDARFYTSKEKGSDLRTEEDWAAVNNTAVGCHREDALVTAEFIITAVLTRVPMFVGVLLSVVRSINIGDPFYQPCKTALLASIALWIISWTVLAISASQVPILFIYDDFYLMKDSFYRLLVNNVTPVNISSIQCWEYMFIMMLSFLVPIVVMLASTITQIGILYKSRLGGVTSDHIQITITIVIITSIAMVCAMPSSMYVAASWAKIGAISSGYVLDASQAFLYGFGLPALNSAVNPVVLIFRSSALRGHWRAYTKQRSGGSRATKMSRNVSTTGEINN